MLCEELKKCRVNDSMEKRKYHLINWEAMCKPVNQGGLGIHSIGKLNKALPGKWLWKVGEPGHSLWKQVFLKK